MGEQWGNTQAQASRENRYEAQEVPDYEEIVPPMRIRLDSARVGPTRGQGAIPKHANYYNVLSGGGVQKHQAQRKQVDNTGQSQLEIQKLERVEMGLSDNKSQNQGRPEYEKAEAENEILGGAKDGASKVDGGEEEDLSDHTLTGGSE